RAGDHWCSDIHRRAFRINLYPDCGGQKTPGGSQPSVDPEFAFRPWLLGRRVAEVARLEQPALHHLSNPIEKGFVRAGRLGRRSLCEVALDRRTDDLAS